MKSKALGFVTIAILILCCLPIQGAQEGEDTPGARSAFLESRKKKSTSDANGSKTYPPQTRRRPRPALNDSANDHFNLVSAIGLGYRIYRRINHDDIVTVNPSSIFRYQDAIRIVLEPNVDGYLYVFHTENGQNPEMIFPDMRLNRGINRISAHVPYEVPSSKELDPRFRWFYFDATPASEGLYFVVSTRPLMGVPIASELVAYCQGYSKGCPWRPATDVWSLIRRTADAPVHASSRSVFDQKQTSVERVAIDRGLGLPDGAPEPSVVRMSSSPGATLLVTLVELIHR